MAIKAIKKRAPKKERSPFKWLKDIPPEDRIVYVGIVVVFLIFARSLFFASGQFDSIFWTGVMAMLAICFIIFIKYRYTQKRR